MTPQALVATLSQRLGDKVCLAAETIDDVHGLAPGEEVAVQNAISKRRAEFAAGRRAARTALAALGREQATILTAASRAPIWPDGITGSITHDQGLALAILAETRHVAALGIDLTQAAPLPGQTRNSILRAPAETTLTEIEARAAFAIKECLFKALYPRVERFFGFDAAIATPDLEGQGFTATLTEDLGPYPNGAHFSGVLVGGPAWITAALAIPAQ
ncbi:MAG: hypothetical protein ABJF50_18635 [Paracoccaceae bacterium]